MNSKLKLEEEKEVANLFDNIKVLIEESRNKVYRTVNTEMINLYWNIGKKIVEMQDGKTKAQYGDYLINELSIKLTTKFGKGFSKSNLKNMRQFYQEFPISQTLSCQLTRSHYLELMKIDDKNIRNFYMHECINSNWNVRELERQGTTLLYEK